MARGATGEGSAAAVPHLLHVFPTFAIGGVQLRIAEIVNRFGVRYRHSIIALDGCTDAAGRFAAGTRYEIIPSPIRPGPLGIFSRLLQMRSCVAGANPDLLLTYNWGAVEWALMARIFRPCRHVHLESGFGPEEAERQLPRRMWFRRAALAPPSVLVVPSRNLVNIAVNVWKLDPGMIRYIPNGVDAEKFFRQPRPDAIPSFAKKPGEVVIGTIAPLRKEKNVGRLIRAFAKVARLAAVRLLIVGDGPERSDLERIARETGAKSRIVFVGEVKAPEDVIGLFDVYAISSDTEQMPNTVLQAMAAGLPVAGLDVGDVRVIVAPSNKPYIAPAGDDTAFAEALTRLVRDGEARQAVGRDNRLRAQQDFSLQRMCAAYAALFDSAAVPGAPPG